MHNMICCFQPYNNANECPLIIVLNCFIKWIENKKVIFVVKCEQMIVFFRFVSIDCRFKLIISAANLFCLLFVEFDHPRQRAYPAKIR